MPEILSYLCPSCGRQARVGRPCPGCEKPLQKKKHSWESHPTSEGLDLPSDDFDYDDFVAREFGKAPHRKLGVKWYWWLLALIVLAAMAAGALLLR